MAKTTTSTKRKSPPRRDNVRPTNLTLSLEAANLLSALAPGPKSYGQFVSDLIVDHHRRQGFMDFYEREASRQLDKVCKLIRKDLRRSGDA
jgi:hypothetical protein